MVLRGQRQIFGVALITGIIIFCLSITSVPVHAGGGGTRYVAVTGNDSGDCSSALSPCRTIQYAVNQSVSGDRILVAGGTYVYNSTVDTCSFLQTRAVVCFVDKQLTILGGYSTTNWSSANPAANPTIIDGQGTYRGIAAIGYNTTTTYLNMEGFTIQNCQAQGPTYLNPYDPSGVGGGMLVQHASVTLRDVIFRNNRAVGQNTSSGAGGQADGAALRIEEPPVGTTSLLQRVVFDSNQSYGGAGPARGGVAFGALFIYKAAVTIEDSVFTNNLAQAGNSSGSGSYGNPPYAEALGGGIAVEQGTIVLRRVTVTGNQVMGGNATQYGGGAYGGGIFVEDFGNRVTSLTISDSYIANNIAMAGSAATGGNAAGAGLCVDSSAVTIERSQFVSNYVAGGNSSAGGKAGPGAGGGIYIFAIRSGTFNATIRNVVVAGNSAEQGNGVTQLGNGGGGGIVIHGVNADMSHITIAHNRIGSNLVLGQGLLIQPWPSPQNPQLPAIVNLGYSIIADQNGGASQASAIVVQQGSALTFNKGVFSNNTKDTNADGIPVPPGTINGLSTMQSVPSVGFVAPGSPHYNYHLRLDSPIKDWAVGSSVPNDIDGYPRPYGSAPDPGADEYWSLSLSALPGDRTIRLDWTQGASVFSGGVSRYDLLVTCVAGADPPAQGSCGVPINVGTQTNFTLTGLSNSKPYTVVVKAYDAAGTLIAESVAVSVTPTDTLYYLYLPLVLK